MSYDADLDTAWPLPTARPWAPNHPHRPTAAPVAEPRFVVLDAEPDGQPETIWWRDAATAWPDADLTVLLDTTDADHPIVQGWWDGEQWCLCESGGTAEPGSVRRWAEVVGVNVKLNGPL